MAKTLLVRIWTPCQSFSVPGRGWRFEGRKPAPPTRGAAQICGSCCSAPVEEVGGPIVHLAAPDSHDCVGAVNGPAATAFFESIDNNGPAAAFDAAAATGETLPCRDIVAHAVQVGSARIHERPDRG